MCLDCTAGAVSEGSYFGTDHELFLSMLLSGESCPFSLFTVISTRVKGVFRDFVSLLSSAGAEGRYALEIMHSATVAIPANLVDGQSGMVAGPVDTARPVWTYTGEGAAFRIGTGADLEIRQLVVRATSDQAFRVDAGATMTGSPWLEAGPLSCDVLVAGVSGVTGLDCEDNVVAPAAGGVTLAGPIIVTSSGSTLPLGTVQYVGGVLDDFFAAMFGADAGIYTLHMPGDQTVTTTTYVQPLMRVSVINDADETETPACTTVSGRSCVFPFEYNGVSYNECTDVDNDGSPW